VATSFTTSTIKDEQSFRDVGYSRSGQGFTMGIAQRSVDGVRGNMSDVIRKAVELADGFEMHHDGEGFVRYFDKEQQDFISFYFHPDYKDELQFGSDALAAQLVRQVDAELPQQDWFTLSRPFYKTNGLDRTMNTIKAIVDSKVLERIEAPHE